MKYKLLGIVNIAIAFVLIGTFGTVIFLFLPKLVDFLARYGESSLLTPTYTALVIIFVSGLVNFLVALRLFSKYLDTREKYLKISIIVILTSIIIYAFSIMTISNSPIYRDLVILE